MTKEIIFPQTIKVTEPSWGESFLQVVKTAVAATSIPVISPVLCGFFEQKLGEMAQSRFQELINDIADYIVKQPQEILNSEAFAIATEITIKNIVNEHNKNKRQRFSKLYKKFIKQYRLNQESPLIEELNIFSSSLTRLSENSLYILAQLQNIELTKDSFQDSSAKSKFEKFKSILKSDLGDRYKDRFMSELESTGLIAKSSGAWSQGTPYITDTGLDFLEWLRDDDL